MVNGSDPACAWLVASEADQQFEAGAEIGVPAVAVRRVLAGDRAADAKLFTSLFRWVKARDKAFFSRIAQGLVTPRFSAWARLLRGNRFEFVSRAMGRRSLIDAVVNEKKLELPEAGRVLLGQSLETFRDVTASSLYSLLAIDFRVQHFAKYRMKDRYKRQMAQVLFQQQTTDLTLKQINREIDLHVLRVLRVYASHFWRDYQNALQSDYIVEELIEAALPEFTRRHFYPPAAQEFLREFLTEAFIAKPDELNDGRDVREEMLRFLATQFRAFVAAQPVPTENLTPKARELGTGTNQPGTTSPAIAPVTAVVENPGGRIDSPHPAPRPRKEFRRKPKPLVPVGEAKGETEISPTPIDVEGIFYSHRLSDLHHAELMRWLWDLEDDEFDFVVAEFDHIFKTPPREWRHTKPLRDGLHELKVLHTLKRVFFYIGNGGLRVVEGHNDPKHNSDYERRDYSNLRSEIRANLYLFMQKTQS